MKHQIELLGGPEDGKIMSFLGVPPPILTVPVVNTTEVIYEKETNSIPQVDIQTVEYRLTGRIRAGRRIYLITK